MILRYTPAKTQFTSGEQVTLDLRECPMVLVELAKVPAEARHGPLIVNPVPGFPTVRMPITNCGAVCVRLLDIRGKAYGAATCARVR